MRRVKQDPLPKKYESLAETKLGETFLVLDAKTSGGQRNPAGPGGQCRETRAYDEMSIR